VAGRHADLLNRQTDPCRLSGLIWSSGADRSGPAGPRNGGRELLSPEACGLIPRAANKSSPAVLRFAAGLRLRRPAPLDLLIAIEAAMGAVRQHHRKSRRVTPYRLATAGLHAPLTEPDMRVSRHPALYAWR